MSEGASHRNEKQPCPRRRGTKGRVMQKQPARPIPARHRPRQKRLRPRRHPPTPELPPAGHPEPSQPVQPPQPGQPTPAPPGDRPPGPDIDVPSPATPRNRAADDANFADWPDHGQRAADPHEPLPLPANRRAGAAGPGLAPEPRRVHHRFEIGQRVGEIMRCAPRRTGPGRAGHRSPPRRPPPPPHLVLVEVVVIPLEARVTHQNGAA